MLTTAPQPFRLLLDAWREVGRNLDIDASVHALAPRIAAVLPFRRLLVRVTDVERGRIDTVAAAGEDDLDGPIPARTTLERADAEALAEWAAAGHVSAWRAGQGGAVRALVAPPGMRRSILAGPLGEGGAVAGLLVLEVNGDPAPHAGLVQALLEPFAVALQNDRRLHEVARLREAAEADNRALLTRLQRQDVSDAIVGSEAGLREVMSRVEQVARTDAPVLILGETGSGKEVVARAIHTRSRRSAGPFLRVNCGAIPSELIDSELFGHERGSFTGATGTRQGWFERADGGTLFLDEIGELPAAAQVRLLRVLQDGSFERVGGQHERTADVRIVAATHRDMAALVRQGRFREDLWYRVSVFPVRLPPLRDRRDDVPALVAHFADRAGLRLFGVPLTPTADDTRMLQAYDWPGNVRELAAVIERAAILGDGRRLEVRTALGLSPTAAPAPAPSPGPAVGALEAANRTAITDALGRARGRIEGPFGAAALLGINPHTLRSRMRKMGIAWSDFRGAR
jgi:hydrogenase-4 transcriptional activator